MVGQYEVHQNTSLSTTERSPMPRIIIQANPPGAELAEITLSEHVVAANLDAAHYSAQLLERLTWATADAEALESRTRAREPGDDTIPSSLPRRRKSPRDLARPPHAPQGASLSGSEGVV
jgi:hypothetical protein